MTYSGEISQTKSTKVAFLVTITDDTGRFFGTFPALTRWGTEARPFDLLGTLREWQEDGLESLNVHRRRRLIEPG